MSENFPTDLERVDILTVEINSTGNKLIFYLLAISIKDFRSLSQVKLMLL